MVPGTNLTVEDARAGNFEGSEIPDDLQRQWIQGTGPAAKPRATVESSIRNVAYALLSGADGWMFDGEDALGQVSTMSLDNQRNLKLALGRDPIFLAAAERVAGQMNDWAGSFFGRPIVEDWEKQLDFTTKIFRSRALHLDDRHVRCADGTGFPASVTDTVLYVVNNHERLRQAGSSIVLYLPKIQTAEEAVVWNGMLTALEQHLSLPDGAIKVYVLVEQVEACFQLMEIRAALGTHFVGYNTGRWDYINSVSDAMAWDPDFLNPNIDAIVMTYGYMADLRGSRPTRRQHPRPQRSSYVVAGGNGTEHPGRLRSGSRSQHAEGRCRGRTRRKRRRERQVGRPLEDGPHRQTGVGEDGQAKPAGSRVRAADLQRRGRRGVDDSRSGATDHSRRTGPAQRGPAIRQRLRARLSGGSTQARRLLRTRRRPVPDGRYGHGRDPPQHSLGVGAQGRPSHRRRTRKPGIQAGDTFTVDLFHRLLAEEYEKLRGASNRNVHDDSKDTTLPIAREIVEGYVTDALKTPWYIDLLNINLNNHDLDTAKKRIAMYVDAFGSNGERINAKPRLRSFELARISHQWSAEQRRIHPPLLRCAWRRLRRFGDDNW